MNAELMDCGHSWSETTNSLRVSAEKNRVPLMGAFEITARCNLACKMCYIHREDSEEIVAREKSARDWIEMGQQAVRAGTLFLLVTGGEPLIRGDFKDIFLGLNSLGMVITLLTNATLINEGTVRWLAKTPPSKVGVTLYGASPNTYEQVTGSRDGFRLALKGIDLLLNAGIAVDLRTTITKQNKNDLGKMTSLASDRGLVLEPTFVLRRPVRGASSKADNERLSSEEALPLWGKQLGAKVSVTAARPGQVCSEAMFCAAGKCSYWVSWDGKMLPCGLMCSPTAEPFFNGFYAAWESLKKTVSTIPSPPECARCEYRPYCEVCPGKLQAETGSFTRISPYICQNAKLMKGRIKNDE